MRRPIESAAHRVLLMVLRCKNTNDRAALCYGTLKRKDTEALRMGVEWAIERGFVQYGTTNVSARAYSTAYAPVDSMLYLTKAGKAWLRTFGTDFGSAKLQAELLDLARWTKAPAVEA